MGWGQLKLDKSHIKYEYVMSSALSEESVTLSSYVVVDRDYSLNEEEPAQKKCVLNCRISNFIIYYNNV